MGNLAMEGKRAVEIEPAPVVSGKAADLMEQIGIVAQFIAGLELDHAPLVRLAAAQGRHHLETGPDSLILIEVELLGPSHRVPGLADILGFAQLKGAEPRTHQGFRRRRHGRAG